MKPLEVCETEYFANFIQNFTSGFFMIPNKTFLITMLKLKYESYVNMLSDIFNIQKYLCVSVEIWITDGGSYIGITCHFLNKNYHRNSYVLGYKKIKNIRDYADIARIINDVFDRYKIKDENISFILTDNTSNFGTIFSNFSHQCIDTTFSPITNLNNSGTHSNDQLSNNNDNETNILVHGIQNIKYNWNIFNSLYLLSFVSNNTNYIKCPTYLLNLVVSFDVTEIGDVNFEQISKTTFKKLHCFWTHINESHEDFSIPVYYRWNTVYNAIKQLINEKEKAINVFNELNINTLNDSEWLFLQEYYWVITPFNKIFDVLQNEDNNYLGHLAPSILKLYKSLTKRKNLIYCNPLCFKLINNIKTRFYFLFDLTQPESKPYVLAAISHPKFKIDWILNEKELDHCKTLFLDEVSLYNSQDVNKTPYYNCLNQAFAYLKSPSKSFSIFNIFPLVKKMFIKYNTVFPSFIPVERLFCDGSQIMSPYRNHIDPEEFEMLLCCRCLNLDINK